MAIFVMSSAVSCLFVSILFVLRPLSDRNPDGTFRKRQKLFLVLYYATNALVLAALLCIVLAVGYLIVFLPLQIDNGLQNWWDEFTEEWFAQCLLGLAFGAILAVWLRRIYRMDPKAELSLTQKVEGVVLLLLFIVGTTSTPLSELLKGATIETGIVDLKLAGATSGTVETSNKIAPSINIPNNPQPSDEEVGLKTIAELHLSMRYDADRIGRIWPDDQENSNEVVIASSTLQAASKKYEQNIVEFTKCLRFIVRATSDTQYPRAVLVGLKPRVAELYYLSLAKLSSNDEAKRASIDTEIEATAKSLAYAITWARRKTTAHAKRVQLLGESTQSECQAATDSYSETELKDILGERRPYLAILYAAILQLEHQEIIAVKILDDWLDRFDKAAEEAEADTVTPWLRLRVYSTQYLLYESLFRRNPTQPQIILDEHLRHLQLLVNAYQDRRPIRDFYEGTFINNNIDLIADNFESEPEYRASCPTASIPDDITLSYGLLNVKAVFARRMIQHPNFANEYLPLARSYSEHIVNADYGCLRKRLSQQPEAVEQARAENVKVFALLSIARAKSRPTVGANYRSWVTRELQLAEAALKFARSVISPYSSDEATELKDELSTLINAVSSELGRWDR